MTREALEKDIQSIIVDTLAKELNVNKEDINEETNPERELGATSAVLVAVALALQAKYDVACSFMKFRRQKTVEDMASFVADAVED